MHTLHSATVADGFIARCTSAWRMWNPKRRTGTTRHKRERRKQLLQHAISDLTPFIPPVKIRNDESLGKETYAVFIRFEWQIYMNEDRFFLKDISPEKFQKLCVTVYHEIRHAEQAFRAAQGLASGQIKFLFEETKTVDKDPVLQKLRQESTKKEIQEEIDDQQTTTERRKQLKKIQGQMDQSSNEGREEGLLSQRINVPRSVARRAVKDKGEFSAWCKTKLMSHAVDGWDGEVEKWIKVFCTRNPIMSVKSAVEDNNNNAVIHKVFYENKPDEVDAFAVERLLAKSLPSQLKSLQMSQ